MAIIEVKAFDWRFADEATAAALIARLTDAFVDVYGEEHRAETWVILDGVRPDRWGFGGEVRS
jgi:4-oxalocrotonate tautomerase